MPLSLPAQADTGMQLSTNVRKTDEQIHNVHLSILDKVFRSRE
nr:MAG TPA: hypothetical protein [Caudoviricetes sp.]